MTPRRQKHIQKWHNICGAGTFSRGVELCAIKLDTNHGRDALDRLSGLRSSRAQTDEKGDSVLILVTWR